LVESLIGAALVLLRLVGENTSLARAGVEGLHLVNTSLLTGTMALLGWATVRAERPRLRPACPLEWFLASSLGAALLVSVTGAITALGDTLYPGDSGRGLAARWA